MREADEQVPDWWNTDVKFDKVLSTFLTVVPSAVFSYMNQPSRNTIIHRCERLVGICRAESKHNVSPTSIVEKSDEKQGLLDDVIYEIEEKGEAVKVEKEEVRGNEKTLIEVTEEIRKKAMKSNISAVKSDGESNILTLSGRKRARR